MTVDDGTGEQNELFLNSQANHGTTDLQTSHYVTEANVFIFIPNMSEIFSKFPL